MPLRPCLDCGKPTDGTRCPTDRLAHDNARYARRGTTAERGLSGAHARMSRHYRETGAACACTTCPEHEGRPCGRHGTPDNPITAGHIIPRSKGGPSVPDNYQPECRRCNSTKGAR